MHEAAKVLFEVVEKYAFDQEANRFLIANGEKYPVGSIEILETRN